MRPYYSQGLSVRAVNEEGQGQLASYIVRDCVLSVVQR